MHSKLNIILFYICCLGIMACQSKNEVLSAIGDQSPRGTFQPLDNETDPDKVDNWFTKGPSQLVEGVDVERAYNELPINKPNQEIVVAVIDGGIDIHHEDLRDKIWINQKEANGLKDVDDDQNGYIDDIHGWNFLGGYDSHGNPTHINQERLENTRELARLRKLKSELNARGENLPPSEQAYFEKLNVQNAGDRNVVSFQLYYTENALRRLEEQFQIVKSAILLPFEQLTIEHVEKFIPVTQEQNAAKIALLNEFTANNAKSVPRLHLRLATLQQALGTALNENFNPRKQIINDDPDNFTHGNYGNNDVIGPDALHGTHVAGIIAAIRNNNIGIKGVSQFAKIMAIRAVPNGDEYDKDIYFAVKYAVDNGAKIINMSFGKRQSPHKSKMDEIFKYASNKGVLLIHAAGNSAFNNDRIEIFPNRYYDYPRLDSEIKTWLEVGASTRHNTPALIANFSNYGKRTVDIFAPGLEINSTLPGNTYGIFSGTSMSTPVVAGVASLLMAQNPRLSAVEIKNVILKNGRDKSILQVATPGLGDKVLFSQLCRTGMVVDGYQALQSLSH